MTAQGRQSRFFTSLAGAGADGMLTYHMLAAGKLRFGRYAYYLRAAGLLARKRFPPFDVTYTLRNGDERSLRAVSAMAVRVSDLGGLFRPLVAPATLEHTHLSLTAVKPPSLISVPAWFGLSWLGLGSRNPFGSRLEVTNFRCGEGHDYPVQVQADGEWLGRTPMSVRIVPGAIRLFLPESSTSR